MTLTEILTRAPGSSTDLLGWSESMRACARTTPDVLAVLDPGAGEGPLTYACLVARVDALAARLADAGAGAGDVVAVSLDRSVDAVVAMVAVLESGAAYCPLDPEAPKAHRAGILDRLRVRLAVARGPVGGGTPILEPDGPRDPELGAASVPRELDPDSVAYVLHTSGSTGRPKGVAMTRRGLERLVRWQVGDGPTGLRTVQFTATTFDVTFQEVLSTLATGGCLVLASERVRRDPDLLLDLMVDQGVQRVFLPYVALQLLASAAVRRGVRVTSLEHVVTAGERLVATADIRAFFGAHLGCRLDNHYGPTEAHLATRHTLTGPPEEWPQLPPIGRPVAGVTCTLLGEDVRPVADGQVGELHLGGVGLAHGYLADGPRTAERFLADPWTAAGRLYRTGDLARSVDGQLEFVARNDRQLKVRGFRVEPAEVEDALLHHEEVDAASVAMRDLADGMPGLVAYLQTEAPLGQRELAAFVADRLPAHMVPSRFVLLRSLPRTSTGKVDTAGLAALPLSDADVDAAAATLPDVVREIWHRVLGHDDFDDDEDFFDVGGDSLLATWVVAELQQRLGAGLGLSAFLEDSTVEGLVRAAEGEGARTERSGSSSRLVTLRPGPSGRSLHLVHPLGGELLCYRELARAVSAPFRLVGAAWAGGAPHGLSLEEIAAVHVAQIRAIQPEGPYLLAGWSFGGVLAYEMAQRLTADGARVEFLGLIDANPVIDPITGLPLAETPYVDLFTSFRAGLDGATKDGEALADLTSGPVWAQLMGAPLPDGAPRGYLHELLATAQACMAAAARYRPRTYAGPVTLFGSADRPEAEQVRLVAALEALCPGSVTVAALEGDHQGLLRAPAVSALAQSIDRALERAGEDDGDDHGSRG